MSQVKKIIKDSTVYSVGTVVAQVIGVFTSIAMRRFLSPETMGIWTILLLIVEYSLFAELGIFSAAVVKIPYLRGKKQSSEIQNVRNSIFTFAVTLSLAAMSALLIFSLIMSNRFPSYVILGIRIIALVVAITFFYNLYIVMLRADKYFSLLSKAMVVNSLAMLVFVSTLTYFFKLKGMYFATLLATIVSAAYIKLNTKYEFKLYFNPQLFRSLSKVGLPIFIVGIVYMLLFSIDKIMIAKMIGPRELGFYSIAILALTYAYNLPKIFGLVVFPTMQEEFAKNDSKERVLAFVKKPMLVMAYLFPAVLALAYFGIPVVVYYILPKYILGIGSMKVLLCGCFFISLVPLMQNFIITINRQTIMIFMTAAVVLLGICINYTLIKMGYGIIGVAVGTSITYFSYFSVMFFYVLSHCEKWSEIFLSFFKICVPFIYSAIMVMLLEHFVKTSSLIIDAIIDILVFSLAYLPMLLYVNKKMDLMARIFKKENKILPEGGIDEASYPNTVLQ